MFNLVKNTTDYTDIVRISTKLVITVIFRIILNNFLFDCEVGYSNNKKLLISSFVQNRIMFTSFLNKIPIYFCIMCMSAQ